jgi:ribose 5-phosphate isomerase RpiB
VRIWVVTPFEFGRHMNRLKKITVIEELTARK